MVLIKNIDNVLPDARKRGAPGRSSWWRPLLACGSAAALDQAEALNGPRRRARSGRRRSTRRARSYRRAARPLPAGRIDARDKARLLCERLDRPLRVCGVVRNHGEPGGGPFWVEVRRGRGRSLQIVETSQIDPDDPDQQSSSLRPPPTSTRSTSPAPCATATAAPTTSQRYVDPSTVFIAEKSHEGRPLNALERPGLWNGAMAGWNTVFVEVPDATFAPVKTVLDLLRPEHRFEPR